MPKHPSHLVELAKRGAALRLQELANEARWLVEIFPHLRDSFDTDELPIPFILAKGSGRLKRTSASTSPKYRPYRMSAAARKAVSARMKKYWASRRNAKP
jgi:hypothetical protein